MNLIHHCKWLTSKNYRTHYYARMMIGRHRAVCSVFETLLHSYSIEALRFLYVYGADSYLTRKILDRVMAEKEEENRHGHP